MKYIDGKTIVGGVIAVLLAGLIMHQFRSKTELLEGAHQGYASNT